jgi:pimeloyl-ACP methyl ester carboxylesterase
MHFVTSTDGTEIAYEKNVDGRPVVLIHGTSGTRITWRFLAPLLYEKHTVVTYDRRGRGASTDSSEYGLKREVDDAKSVLDAVDGNPVVFGHSFGGLVALETVRRAEVDSLVLYEPAVLTDRNAENQDIVARMGELVKDGDERRAVETYFRRAGGMTNPDEELIERGVSMIDTVLRECRIVEDYRLDDGTGVRVPTLLLTGEDGPQHLRDSVHRLHEYIGRSRLVELEGVGHAGVVSDPEQVAEEVGAFVDEYRPATVNK